MQPVLRYYLLLNFLLAFLYVEAQQPSGFNLAIEYGNLKFSGDIDSRWEFRKAISESYDIWDYYHSETVIGEGQLQYAGLKAGYSIWDSRVTISSGVRYIDVKEQISPSANSNRLYLYHPSSEGIELFRLWGIEESVGYIAIPFEADLLLLGHRSNWQFFTKLGIQAGVKVNGDRRIDFVDNSMKIYENDIFSAAGGSTSDFFSNIYGGLGLRLILNGGLCLSIETVSSPSPLTRENFSLLSAKSISGVQLQIKVPTTIFSISRK